MEDESSGPAPPLLQYLIANAPPHMYYIPDFISTEEEEHILSQIPPNKWITLSHRCLQPWPSQLTSKNTLLLNSRNGSNTTSSKTSTVNSKAQTNGATTNNSSSLPTWLASPIIPRINSLGKSTGEDILREAPHGMNHCLVNKYEPGQGILPHEDGPAYFPVVATVSLGGSGVLDVYEKQDHHYDQRQPDDTRNEDGKDYKEDEHRSPQSDAQEEEGNSTTTNSRRRPQLCRIFQPRRSLLLTTGSAYTDTLHGIAETRMDAGLGPETVANWELLGEKVRREILDAGGRCERSTTRISLTYRDVLKVVDVGNKVFGLRGKR